MDGLTELDRLARLLVFHPEAAVLSILELNRESVVVVVGAYQGDTIAFLDFLYAPIIHGYDPQGWAIDRGRWRFRERPDIHLYPHGLGKATGSFPMGEWGNDACSFVPLEAPRVMGQGQMVDIATVMERDGLDLIDLMVLNIEGGEYDLLAHLIDEGLIPQIKHLLVQFHFPDRYRHQRAVIEQAMRQDFQKMVELGGDWVWWVRTSYFLE